MGGKRSIRLVLDIRHEPPFYVSECPQLGLASSGDTEQEALANIAEAVVLYLDTLEEYGECDAVLERAGIPIIQDSVVICEPHGQGYTAMVHLPEPRTRALA